MTNQEKRGAALICLSCGVPSSHRATLLSENEEPLMTELHGEHFSDQQLRALLAK
jgi:hypothetical protein